MHFKLQKKRPISKRDTVGFKCTNSQFTCSVNLFEPQTQTTKLMSSQIDLKPRVLKKGPKLTPA